MNMWSPERTIDIIRIIGIQAHTASIELPIKISSSFTAYPMFRYYTQTASLLCPYENICQRKNIILLIMICLNSPAINMV
jgi:hypothetical protein